MPVYIGKSGDLVGCYRCLTHSQTENSATQLVSCIKHKLSHAITTFLEPFPNDVVGLEEKKVLIIIFLYFQKYFCPKGRITSTHY